ncbi:hypothetical protein ACV22X_20795 [Burkholderia orbicola]
MMMNILKIGAAALATATAFALPVGASAQSRGKVLVVMSSAHALDLRDGRKLANWHSNVVVDRELITGQQPMSAPEFGDVLVAKLKARTN